MPPGCELLVQGDFTENQAFHWRERMFGVQFHPETDPEILRFVWTPRLESWRGKVSFDLSERLQRMRPAPQAAEVLRNFVSCCGPAVTKD
jgi:GMP synthase-like glutamine amidotransferase